MRTRQHNPSLILVAAAFTALAADGARADEPTPWYAGVTQSLTHDTNVYRLADGPGDTYSSTGLIGGFDQPYGRQRFYSAANLTYNKYRSQNSQDNTSYGANAGWDWQTVYNLSGGVNASASQSLAQLNGNLPVSGTSNNGGNFNNGNNGRNLVKSDQFGGGVNWGGNGYLGVQALYSHSRTRYSQQIISASQQTGDTASLGAVYNLSPDLSTGLAYRLTRNRSPDYTSGSSDGRNIDLTANWRYTPKSGVNGRLSFTRQTNSGGSSQSFSGLTGALSASYLPTAKIGVNLAYNRDAGTNGTSFGAYYGPGSVNGGVNGATAGGTTGGNGGTGGTPPITLFENSQVTDSLLFGATYAATAKIAASANYQYRRAKIVGGGLSSYNDNLKVASLGATWAIQRPWQLACNLSHENRTANNATGFTYSANVIGCTAQLTLR